MPAVIGPTLFDLVQRCALAVLALGRELVVCAVVDTRTTRLVLMHGNTSRTAERAATDRRTHPALYQHETYLLAAVPCKNFEAAPVGSGWEDLQRGPRVIANAQSAGLGRNTPTREDAREGVACTRCCDLVRRAVKLGVLGHVGCCRCCFASVTMLECSV